MTNCSTTVRKSRAFAVVAAFMVSSACGEARAESDSTPPPACRIVIDDLSGSFVQQADGVPASEPNSSQIELADYSEVTACDSELADCDAAPCTESTSEPPLPKFGDWLGYHSHHDGLTWMMSGDFSLTSLEWFPALDVGDEAGVRFGSGFHFLGGPTTTDLPPRLFDFQMAFLTRKPLTDATTLDIKLGVGAFSDFETSARKGVRFPGHVVAHTQRHDRLATVFGVDVLDRDDITLLPVAGLIWRPHDDLILDVVFPRPMIQLRYSDNGVVFLRGEVGGGTWAVQRDDRSRDNVTYHDLRLTAGFQDFGDESESLFELGWVFDRELTFRSQRGDTRLDGAFLLRWQTLY